MNRKSPVSYLDLEALINSALGSEQDFLVSYHTLRNEFSANTYTNTHAQTIRNRDYLQTPQITQIQTNTLMLGLDKVRNQWTILCYR